MRRNGRLWLRRRVHSRVECQGFFELFKIIKYKINKDGRRGPATGRSTPEPNQCAGL